MTARVRPGRVLLSQETWRALLGELDELRRQVREMRRLVPGTMPAGGTPPAEPLSSGALALLRWMRRRHWDTPRISILASRGPTCIRTAAAVDAAVVQLLAHGLARRQVRDGLAYLELVPEGAQDAPGQPAAVPEASEAAEEPDYDPPTYAVIERLDGEGHPTGRYFTGFSRIDAPLTTADPAQAKHWSTQGQAILWLSGERKRLRGFRVREFELVAGIAA